MSAWDEYAASDLGQLEYAREEIRYLRAELKTLLNKNAQLAWEVEQLRQQLEGGKP